MTNARKPTAPLEREKAVAIMAGAAADIDNLCVRVSNRVRKLEQAQADPQLIEATRTAAKSLVQVAKVLRQDGYLGHAKGAAARKRRNGSRPKS